MISQFPVASLVLVGLLPLYDTPMERITPPSPEEMGELFLQARLLFPRTPVLLGYERPAGEHKWQTDLYALKAGLNGIAYPAEGIVGVAQELGLQPIFSPWCCSLVFQMKRDEGHTSKSTILQDAERSGPDEGRFVSTQTPCDRSGGAL